MRRLTVGVDFMTTSSTSSTTRRLGVVMVGVAVFCSRLVEFDADASVMVRSGGLVVVGDVFSELEAVLSKGCVELSSDVSFLNSCDGVAEGDGVGGVPTCVETDKGEAVVIADVCCGGADVLAKAEVEIVCAVVLSCGKDSEWLALWPSTRLVETSSARDVLVEVDPSVTKSGVVSGAWVMVLVVMLTPNGVELSAASGSAPWQHRPKSRRTTRMPCTSGKASDVMAPREGSRSRGLQS